LIRALESAKPPMWNRAPGQSCRIPTVLANKLDSGGRGVSAASFSPEGRHLALAGPAVNGRSSVISIFDFAAGSDGPFPRLMSFGGHTGPVYELDWADHKTLLSASGDGTAQVWHLSEGQRETLEHPTFVYCARFHPSAKGRLIITGGYDKVIRVWKKQNEDEGNTVGGEAYAISQELVEHEAYITALELDADGQVRKKVLQFDQYIVRIFCRISFPRIIRERSRCGRSSAAPREIVGIRLTIRPLPISSFASRDNSNCPLFKDTPWRR